MKKFAFLIYILCLSVLLQCTVLPAVAMGNLETVPQETQSAVPGSELPMVQTEVPFGSVCIQQGCRTIEGMIPLGGSDRKLETAQGVMVFERNTGTVIYSYNPDSRLSPGTLTKIVTALVVIENCDLNDIVTCSSGIQSKVPAGASIVDLKSEEQLSVEELLYCLILQGANDAAVALAEHVAGTTANFLSLMNERVKRIGCTGTEFGNISGLDTAVSYTTARDMTKIYVEAMKNETLRAVFSADAYTVPATNKHEAREFNSLNYLKEPRTVPKYNDRRVTGGYGSYVSVNSGASIAFTAESNGLDIVCVILGATRRYYENGWQVEYYGNFDEAIEIIGYVFDNYKVARVIYEGQALQQFTVAGGECDVVGAPHVNIDSVLPVDAHMTNLILDVDTGGDMTAPIQRDQKIGTVGVYYRHVCLMEAELYAMNDVRVSDNASAIRDPSGTNDGQGSKVMSIIGTICVIILGGFGVYLIINNIRRARIRRQRARRRSNRRRSY